MKLINDRRLRRLVAAVISSLLIGPAFAHGDAPTEDVDAAIDAARRATAKYQDVKVALADSFLPDFGCVDQPGQGGMGIHYINAGRVGNPKIEALEPEILVYEPDKHGRLQLVALEYLVLRDVWDAANPQPPMLFGHPFHLVRAPNRYGLPDFYELHLWAWKKNKNGIFNDWNPAVQCHSEASASAAR
jgi:hypothetical protein